jgi:hypothetical protein
MYILVTYMKNYDMHVMSSTLADVFDRWTYIGLLVNNADTF